MTIPDAPPPDRGERLHTDLTRTPDKALRLLTAFLHRLAHDRPNTSEGNLALELAADLDDALAHRAQRLRALADELDL